MRPLPVVTEDEAHNSVNSDKNGGVQNFLFRFIMNVAGRFGRRKRRLVVQHAR